MIARRIFLAITFAATLIVPTAVARAQSGGSGQSATQPASVPTPGYALIEYFKIEPGKAAEYRKLEQEVWVPIHRERVKQRIIKSWWSWGVRFPGGSDREYDRVIITTFDKFTDVETPYPPEIFAKVFPNSTAADLVARTLAISKLVRSELVALLDNTTSTGEAQIPKFAQIGFHKPEFGKTLEAVEMERKQWKPIHQERVNRGILNAWMLFGARFPGGTNREYGYITINFFDKFGSLETLYPPELVAKVHPNLKFVDLTAQTGAVVKMVRSELLTLVDYVQ